VELKTGTQPLFAQFLHEILGLDAGRGLMQIDVDERHVVGQPAADEGRQRSELGAFKHLRLGQDNALLVGRQRPDDVEDALTRATSGRPRSSASRCSSPTSPACLLLPAPQWQSLSVS
jgi:hypothetical protein